MVGPHPGPRPALRMALVAALLLFFELACLRWFPAQVRHLGYFTNFVLLAAFLGMGAGCLAGRRWGSLLHLFPASVLGAQGLVWLFRLEMRIDSAEVIYFQNSRQELIPLEPAYMIPLLFLVLAGLFALPSSELSGLFRAMAPLPAYRANLLGSLAGIVGFSALSWFSTPPAVWLGVVFGLWLALTSGGRGRAGQALAILLSLALTAAMDGGARWSPYYKIETRPILHQGQPLGWDVWANNTGHQMLIPSAYVDQEPMYGELFRQLPDRHFKRVLIVGAGGGRDTAYLLARTGGAVEIEAVEIDPVLLELGLTAHPERPYLRPQVRTRNTDGRAFLTRGLAPGEAPYEAVIFALPDSLVLASSYSSLRLESYLFTVEAFQAVRDMLTEDGVFVIYNGFRRPWLVDKLAGMLTEAFGRRPALSQFPDTTSCLIAGPGARALPEAEIQPEVPATDDWPFLYLRRPSFPTLYLATAAGALALSGLILGGLTRGPGGRLSLGPRQLAFALLGAAFMLLECRSVVLFALLFGSTWQVNAAVFGGIMLLLLAAVELQARGLHPPRAVLIGALVALLAAQWGLPASRFLAWEAPWAGALFYLLPLFVANLLFAGELRDSAEADTDYAANLLGAVAGGLLEYLAMVTGYQALVVGVAGLYLLAGVVQARHEGLGPRPAP